MPRTLASAVRLTLLSAGIAALTACGGVEIKPSAKLPKPLVVALPAQVALVIPGDMREFVHNETRWGVEWNVALGAGHKDLMLEVLKNTFTDVKEYRDIEEARTAPGLKAIFEPRIEQYSFVTARETGGRYYAVTIRYRIDLYTPTGEKVDSLTLTGYGNSLAKGMSSGKPLEQASISAMRDAAAKFLVQFPEQSAGIRLAKNEPVSVESNKAATADIGGIETVPIEEATVDAAPAITPPVPPITPPATPLPTASPAVPKASLISSRPRPASP
jgi:hypothetical protein